jgi:transposase
MRENLSDRQAAQAVQGRIDWKYALSLELTDPGFDFSILSEFRDRILSQLKLGKQATGYKTAQKVLNRFIAELIGSV